VSKAKLTHLALTVFFVLFFAASEILRTGSYLVAAYIIYFSIGMFFFGRGYEVLDRRDKP
jgi:hypothetical protein